MVFGLGVLPASLRFVASQWRIDVGGSGQPLDLVAVDAETGGLVVIELKAGPDPTATAQASRYAAYLRTHADVYGPFFASLATAMAVLYDSVDMPDRVDAAATTGLAAWPSGSSWAITPCP